MPARRRPTAVRPKRTARVLAALAAALAALLPPATATADAPLLSGPVVLAPTGVEATVWVVPAVDGAFEARWESVPGGASRGSATTTGRAGQALALTLVGLEPGREYRGAVGGPAGESTRDGSFAFRTAPRDPSQAAPPEFGFAVLGRHAVADPLLDPPFRPASRDPLVLAAVMARDPAFVLWVGGQASLVPADLDSPGALDRRWRLARGDAAVAPLLAGTGHVVVPAPADLVPGDADGGWPFLALARRAHDRANPVPLPLLGDEGPRVALFRWADCAFFVLDTVTTRRDDPLAARREVLGAAQREWLQRALRQVPATFRVLVSARPLFSPAEDPAHLGWAASEQAAWLDALGVSGVPGIVALSGGPAGEATKAVRARSPDRFEFVAGPATARVPEAAAPLNYFRLPATLAQGPHFGWVTVSGPPDARVLTYAAIAPDGTELWKQSVPAGR